MKSDFTIITEFLERCGPEVAGRACPPPPPELAEKLDRFARGDCDAQDRTALCDLLREQPDYLRILADRVRELRAQAAGSGGKR